MYTHESRRAKKLIPSYFPHLAAGASWQTTITYSNLKLLLLHMAARSCFPSAPARSKHTGADYEKAGFALIGT